MIPQRAVSLLGLCRRAGKVALGDWAVTDALNRGKAELIFLAADAGRSTARRFRGLAQEAGVPLFDQGTRDELGHALGVDPKAVVAVTSPEFARGILDAIAGPSSPAPLIPSGRDRRGT